MRKIEQFDLPALAASNPIDLGVLGQAAAFAAFAESPAGSTPTEYALTAPFGERASLPAQTPSRR